MISDGISPSLSDLLHSVWQSLVPSMLLKMALFLIKFKNSFFKLEINTSGKLPADPVVRTRYCQWRRQGFYFWSGIAHQKKKNLQKLEINQLSSVTQSCPTLCDHMDGSITGLPVHRQLPEFTQTHVHWVGDAIQSSHPLSSPSSPAFNLSQHQGLFQ